MAKYVPRERKHRRLAKQKTQSQSRVEAADSNAQEVVPENQTEREARRATLAADLREQQPQSKISSKKRRRLDKYVDTKLRKEENLELLKKLAAHKVDTSLLQSSKKLGRVHETKRERYGRALQERAAGLDDGGSHDAILYQRRREAKPVAEADDDESETSQDEARDDVAPVASTTSVPVSSFGSGLKRPLETDEAGQPVIKKRKRRKGNARTANKPQPNTAASDDSSDATSDGDADDSEAEWNGFESEDAGESPTSIEPDELFDGRTDNSSISSESDIDESDTSEPDASRVSAFKQWADTQRNAAVGFTPSAVPVDDAAIRANFKPRQASPDPMSSTAPTGGERTSRPSAAITIPRSDEIQAGRLELPVVQEEQKIMEAVHSNPIVIVCGATGSGKTTQVPQMMLESGYGSHVNDTSAASATAGPQSRGMIGVTQPRRVAALSVAERVAVELGPTYRNRVAHQVRYDKNVSKDTAIKFMTDGILLREISKDITLSKYSAVVIDEAHERSVNTDILIGMLSRIVTLRADLAKEEPDKHYPLKLVIMSATLRVSDFAENLRLFRSGPPPIVQAEGRQYPVTVHFSRRTQRDYVTETVEKVARGHRKLPAGGMLVFLTGQDEIQVVAKRLRDRLGSNTAGYSNGKAKQDNERMPMDKDDFEDGYSSKRNNDYLDGEEDRDSDSEAEITGLDPDAEDQEFKVEDDQSHFGPRNHGTLKPHILPLYAALTSAQQLRVFQPPPAGSRLIVLATNVAETSLTIPGVRYVFDCGRAKEKQYDLSTAVQTFEIQWISKASASQRSGRAGRTGPGHCYRLYSSAVYEQFFAEHTVPEILRTPLEGTVLQLKNMAIENVVNFPFPTSPDAVQLVQAERLLKSLGAIREKDGLITELGREIMWFPVSPRFGKMLSIAMRNTVVAHTAALVAGLAVGDLFVPEAQVAGASEAENDVPRSDDDSSDDDRRVRRVAESAAHTAAQQRHQAYTRAHAKLSHFDDQSDALKVLTAVAAHAEHSSPDKPMAAASKFCDEYFLREKGMSEIQHLRQQLHHIVVARQPALIGTLPYILPPPTEKERNMLNQIVTAGFIDQVAIRADLLKDDQPSAFGRKPRRAIEVAYRTLLPSGADAVDKTLSLPEQEMQRSVFIHPSSVLAKLSVKEMPQYVVYSHLSRATPATADTAKVPRTRMHPLTTVQAPQLAKLAEGTPLLEFGKPIGKIEELASSGRRQCWVSVSLRAPGGSSTSWPLGAWKVVQRRGKTDWTVESVVASVIRILFVVPIYGVFSFLGGLFYRNVVYFEVGWNVYEAFVIASFFALTGSYVAPILREQKAYFATLHAKPWPWPLSWVKPCVGGGRGPLKRLTNGLVWINILWIGIFQYCLVKVVLSIVAVILEKVDLYCSSSTSPLFGHIWTMKPTLSEKHASAKLQLVCIMLVVYLTFWQNLVFALLFSEAGPIQPTEFVSFQDLAIGVPIAALNVEMLVYSIMHIFAYSWKDYKLTQDEQRAGAVYYGRLQAVFDVCNVWDIIKAVGRGVRLLWVGRGAWVNRSQRSDGVDKGSDAALELNPIRPKNGDRQESTSALIERVEAAGDAGDAADEQSVDVAWSEIQHRERW
ncbi:hypothetical protein LTR36_000303 [Oleoguttula mirabilis]|uniref:RNA helicase n=1 Tax=Oleoguttula mirabilis TaxID=1507867 RepID=A0AAV9K1D9_9PEZI|nr:hypothetical protein LTR36_000303 [Oleoguttula mirabilis]